MGSLIWGVTFTWYGSYMSIVTPQGKASQAAHKQLVAELSEKVRTTLTKPAQMRDIMNMFPGHKEDDVREAVWRLFDIKEAYLAVNRDIILR